MNFKCTFDKFIGYAKFTSVAAVTIKRYYSTTDFIPYAVPHM